MTKANKPGSHKPATPAKAAGAQQSSVSQKPPVQPTPQEGQATPPRAPGGSKGKQKSNRPAIGGTAVQGAKSMQPKEVPTTSTPQDRPELYNRDLRRRMQHMGTGPYAQGGENPTRRRLDKRREESKKRRDEVKKVVATKGPSTNVRIGSKNLYFLLGALAFILLVIILAIIIRHPF